MLISTRICGSSLKEKIETVFLVNAGNDDRHPSVANYAIFPPLNILSIASTVKHEFKEIKVHIYDGQMHDVNIINTWIKSLEPDVVGISVLSSSYKNAMKHAKAAKEAGAVTILGNDHAAIYGRNILRGENGKYIDYICTADIGELVFCRFLRFLQGKESLKDVPKIMYLPKNNHEPEYTKGNELVNCPHERWLLDQIPLVNWELMSYDLMFKYKMNYQRVYGDLLRDAAEDITAVTINRARGCHRCGNPCLYCGIMDLNPKFSSPTVFWNEVKAAKKGVDANVFYEAFDSMAGFPWWVEELVKQKPQEELKDVRFFVYSEALGITSDLVELYKKLGVYMVNMGLDSGDNEMLKRLKSSKDSVEQNKAAVSLLRKSGIYIYASFVLGAPGETEKSLQNTIDFAGSLIENRNLAAVEVQPLYPLFNAKAGDWLMNPIRARWGAEMMGFEIRNPQRLSEMKDKWGHSDNPNPTEISRDWVDVFCHVDYEDLENAAAQIKEYARNFGIVCGAAW